LTKNDPIENALKYPLSIEDSGRLGLDVGKLVEQNAATLCSQRVFIEDEPKLKVIRTTKKLPAKQIRLCRVTQHLYNLESDNAPEKLLKIELNLYQMEDY
jgi:hypothetical protein